MPTIVTKFQNGDEVKDKITGFQGVVTGFTNYITGCNQILVAPPVKDGDFKESHWFDEDRCELIQGGKVPLATVRDKAGEHPGFDKPAPIK
jgi:hypothetical protein